MVKQAYPNVDGIYHSEKQNIVMKVTRNEIIIEITEPKTPKVIEVDNLQKETKAPLDKKVDAVHKGIKFVNDVLWGPQK